MNARPDFCLSCGNASHALCGLCGGEGAVVVSDMVALALAPVACPACGGEGLTACRACVADPIVAPQPRAARSTPTPRNLEREALRVLWSAAEPMRTSELAERLRLKSGTAWRLLRRMGELGWVLDVGSRNLALWVGMVRPGEAACRKPSASKTARRLAGHASNMEAA